MSIQPLAAHADWSVDPRKRWMTLATPTPSGWMVAAPEPVGPVETLFIRLTSRANGAPVALGVDFPLGLPRAYAANHAATHANFPDFLRALHGTTEFFTVCTETHEISPTRPFYPAHSRAGVTRAELVNSLGLPSPAALYRACDRATESRPAGAPLFWTLGPNQTGKAAISAWRDLLSPALNTKSPPLLWPFDGRLSDLLHPGRIAIAETYPAEALRLLGLKLPGSKRRQSDRAALSPTLHAAMADLPAQPTQDLATAIANGFGADAAGEDRFDSLLGLLNVLLVLEGKRPDVAPDDPILTTWEGWVLGQTDQPL